MRTSRVQRVSGFRLDPASTHMYTHGGQPTGTNRTVRAAVVGSMRRWRSNWNKLEDH